MSLSVVIPSRNASNLIACVQAIAEHEPGLTVIVVDDGLEPTEEQRNVFCSWDCVYWKWGMKPFIFSRNANIGMRKAGTNDVILLNDDAILQTEGGFTALQSVADRHPEFGVIGAVTNVTGQPAQQPAGIGLREVPHFAFVCVLIPRRTILQVGYLDERYCLDYGCEDRDYCESCRRGGWKVGVYDHCYVDHARLRSTYRGDPQAARSFARNLALFEAKWHLA